MFGHLTKRKSCLIIRYLVYVYWTIFLNNLFCYLVYLLVSPTFALLSDYSCFISLNIVGFLVTGCYLDFCYLLDSLMLVNTNPWLAMFYFSPLMHFSHL